MDQQPEYPWFAVARGSSLEQGDLVRRCPRFVLPPNLTHANQGVGERQVVDAILLTQSCDLALRAEGECEATDALLCPFYTRSALASHPVFRKDEAWEEVRKGRRPFYHVMNECRIAGHEQEFVAQGGDRLRLLPPYREHLSQAFARLFMRVGLPADIPPFGKKK